MAATQTVSGRTSILSRRLALAATTGAFIAATVILGGLTGPTGTTDGLTPLAQASYDAGRETGVAAIPGIVWHAGYVTPPALDLLLNLPRWAPESPTAASTARTAAISTPVAAPSVVATPAPLSPATAAASASASASPPATSALVPAVIRVQSRVLVLAQTEPWAAGTSNVADASGGDRAGGVETIDLSGDISSVEHRDGDGCATQTSDSTDGSAHGHVAAARDGEPCPE
ncbi:MAG: hypothetical protein O3B31_01830 [Chloroflexi bacterium]|nr:hypothetical protein [Chloroflexota bacterium]